MERGVGGGPTEAANDFLTPVDGVACIPVCDTAVLGTPNDCRDFGLGVGVLLGETAFIVVVLDARSLFREGVFGTGRE